MSAIQAIRSLAQQAIGQRIRGLTGSRATLDDFATPLGDPGLFGPQAMVWRVHEHFTAMMVGGLSSLMVQALHPLALAAVWDHSDFRQDLKARLGRTAFFVAATTYGSKSLALQTIERVNAIHARITGCDAQGQPYAANDPQLLRWVHLVEVTSFLAAFNHLTATPLTPAQGDQYIAEMAQIGHRLGAIDLPTTLAATQQALLEFQTALRCDERTRDVLQRLETYPTDLHDRPFMALALQAAFDIMPAWALARIGRVPACAVQTQMTRRALQVMTLPVQWALAQQGVAATARRCVQALDHRRW